MLRPWGCRTIAPTRMDGTGDEHHADHVNQCIRKHDTVKEIFALPLFLFAEISVIDTGGDCCICRDEGKRCSQTSLGDLEAKESFGKFSTVRAAHAEERDIESQDHDNDACGDEFLNLRIDVLRKISV